MFKPSKTKCVFCHNSEFSFKLRIMTSTFFVHQISDITSDRVAGDTLSRRSVITIITAIAAVPAKTQWP